ncbi:phage baseplate assembly protein V [Actinokineospora auranticolor]|uniref:Gp5/Type VI secretion system Vgr protein OB-fold domain-containing protein n=1 Tax=Actinokineospora auranticolor TaxID=155976 RepID=A0A2S6GPK6_9PSEU|nr:phage baseplate assembly protein V [Actinokineospora auranticolor]PPK67149.1 hypothetical protein CLV40_108146 [Actinokineospora auranticolor]
MRDIPRAMSTDQRYYGVTVATVVANDGDDEARVKVAYPWFDRGATVSEWARVCQFYAGGGYGAVFVPEIDDEVLIAFYQGDMRIPIVIGGLYNGVDKPPTAHRGGRDQKLIRTRAGHEVLLDDGAKKIVVTGAGGGQVTINDDGSITLKATKVTVDAGTVELAGSAQKAVLGDLLKTAFDTHTHPTPTGPSGPPVIPLPGAVLSSKVSLT